MSLPTDNDETLKASRTSDDASDDDLRHEYQKSETNQVAPGRMFTGGIGDITLRGIRGGKGVKLCTKTKSAREKRSS